MAEYIGLNAIARRLGCSVPTVRRLHADQGLLLYRHRLTRVRPGARGWAWTTNDELLSTWFLARCIADRAYIPPGLRGVNRLHAGAGRDG